MSSFKGQFHYTLDTKGRLNIPAKFRRSLEPEANETFVTIRGFDPCLFLYPLDEWKKFEDKLRQLTTNKKQNRLFIRMITSNASEDRCDKQGRIIIPADLLKIANIERDILIVGALDKIEVWNPQVYQETLEASGENYEDIAEKINFE